MIPAFAAENLDQVIHHARALREKFLADPHRPGYHFVVPETVSRPVDPAPFELKPGEPLTLRVFVDRLSYCTRGQAVAMKALTANGVTRYVPSGSAIRV